MGAILNLVERNLHEVQVDANRMLFHIPAVRCLPAMP